MKERTPVPRPRHTEKTVVMKVPSARKPEGGTVARPPPGRSWRPVRLHLEKVPKRQALALRDLPWLLPAGDPAAVRGALERRLQEILEQPVTLRVEAVHLVPAGGLRQLLGEPTFLASLGRLPQEPRALVEVELGLAHGAIDLMIGGGGEAVGRRPLTDLEEGMMTYLVIEALRALAPALDPAQPRPRLEAVARGFDEVAGLVTEDQRLALVQLKATFGTHVGALRLFVPEELVAQAAATPDAAVRRARRRALAEAHRKRLGRLPVPARVEVGLVEIAAGELAQVRPGDVILVDALGCRPDRAEGGAARLKLGLARAGHAELRVASQGGRFTATVTGFALGPPPVPPPGGAADDSTQPPQPPPPGARGRSSVEGNADGSDLMNDIPLQLSVELARLSITAEEVLAMKVGQVFDLDRTLGAGLDLSVNGRVVARGELVEIDGNLGVRIVSLAG